MMCCIDPGKDQARCPGKIEWLSDKASRIEHWERMVALFARQLSPQNMMLLRSQVWEEPWGVRTHPNSL